jgi:hypothetical protein
MCVVGGGGGAGGWGGGWLVCVCVWQLTSEVLLVWYLTKKPESNLI